MWTVHTLYCAINCRGTYKIALEEHVAFRNMWPLFNDPTPPLPWAYALTDLEDGRLQERIAVMDKGNIAVMVLSVPGGTQNMKNKKTAAADLMKYNKKLAEGVARYPKRLMVSFGLSCCSAMYSFTCSSYNFT
jgi:predicted TIM-barrel fold metal-dependent hydrolase